MHLLHIKKIIEHQIDYEIDNVRCLFSTQYSPILTTTTMSSMYLVEWVSSSAKEVIFEHNAKMSAQNNLS